MNGPGNKCKKHAQSYIRSQRDKIGYLTSHDRHKILVMLQNIYTVRTKLEQKISRGEHHRNLLWKVELTGTIANQPYLY